MSAMEELHALADIITSSVKLIDENCKARNVALPSLSQPYSLESEAARADPTVLRASSDLVAAAAQLTALIRPPSLSLLTIAMQFHVCSALRLAVDTNIVEILREAGPEGLHVEEMAKKAQTNSNKLARVLRLLATEHVFIEISPDVFTNNRISSLMDTGKIVSEILDNPSEKHAGATGISAMVSVMTNHAFKAPSLLTDAILNPEYADSFEPNKTAFNLAFQTDQSLFDFMDCLENKDMLRLFSLAMAGVTGIAPPSSLLDGLDWSRLPEESVVVDVGGGVGSQAMLIARAYSKLKVVVQDREPTIRQAEQYWNEKYPEAIDSGQVELQVHDFFKEQTISNVAVFFMRYVLHDWHDKYCEIILRNIRQAAHPDTQLLIIDNILSYACPQRNSGPGITKEDSENDSIKPLPPLLANGGHANLFGYLADYQMMSFVNGQERTLAQLDTILTNTGWKIIRVIRTPYFADRPQQVIALPF